MIDSGKNVFFHSAGRRVARLEREVDAMRLVLEELGYERCAQGECGVYSAATFREVDGKPYCYRCYPAARARSEGRDAASEPDHDAVYDAGRSAVTAKRLEEPVECRSAPVWAWDIIDEALGIDAVSNASDKELRGEVQRAIDAMTTETAWNSNIAGKES